MNRQIRQLAAGLMTCYVVLFVALNYWQVGRQEELNARFDNTRAIRRQFEQPRGSIVTADGVIVAASVENPPGSPFRYQRTYPEAELFAHITGYYTFAFGSTQLERTQNAVLAGETAEQQLRNLPGIITGDDDSGSVRLTLRADLQRAARDALGEREGSVVVMDPTTGAVLALWSYPSFDPNLVVDPDFDAARAVIEFAGADPRDPLLANTYQQRYMPGSTFKILTTGIALENGVVGLDTVFPDETQYVPPQTTDPIQNFGGTSCGGDLLEVFTRSCNIPFAKLAIELGPERMVEGVAEWGVGEPIPFDLPRPAASTFGDTSNLDQELPLLAIRGFGQNEDQMVPLHMAMVAATIANGGKMMQPYVVDATLDHAGRVLDRTEPEVWKTPISAANAALIGDLMVSVATSGTASCCIALEGGVPVAAKTGTAQLNGPGEPERSHVWITAYAPADDPQYLVAVMIKGTTDEISASTGGRLAGPVAKTVLDVALRGGT
ncbi:MAG: penicillin-binding protein 2 [Acidimicrobiia bacterium]|nr:penicillin-binding protein 2 [Acidimicrobiia bacterium]